MTSCDKNVQMWRRKRRFPCSRMIHTSEVIRKNLTQLAIAVLPHPSYIRQTFPLLTSLFPSPDLSANLRQQKCPCLEHGEVCFQKLSESCGFNYCKGIRSSMDVERNVLNLMDYISKNKIVFSRVTTLWIMLSVLAINFATACRKAKRLSISHFSILWIVLVRRVRWRRCSTNHLPSFGGCSLSWRWFGR